MKLDWFIKENGKMIRKPLYLSQKLNPHKSVVINGE